VRQTFRPGWKSDKEMKREKPSATAEKNSNIAPRKDEGRGIGKKLKNRPCRASASKRVRSGSEAWAFSVPWGEGGVGKRGRGRVPNPQV